jgi:hypothetical protein
MHISRLLHAPVVSRGFPDTYVSIDRVFSPGRLAMARTGEGAHPVKPMMTKDVPAGLYGEPRFRKEGEDIEGFSAHYIYGLIKPACSFDYSII